MSTLKVTTIQDTSGGNASTSEQIAQGRAKVWVSFNGTGTVAIRDSFNVSSITDNDAGDYSVNITNAMANANYAVVGSAGISNAFLSLYIHTKSTSPLQQDPTTTVFRVVTSYSGQNSNRQDSDYVAVAAFGD